MDLAQTGIRVGSCGDETVFGEGKERKGQRYTEALNDERWIRLDGNEVWTFTDKTIRVRREGR